MGFESRAISARVTKQIVMGCRFTFYSLFMDIQNSFLDIHNSFLDSKMNYGYP